MKRYIIEVPEEITADAIGVALEGVVDYTTIEETTMKSQAEIERLAEIGRAVEFFADKTDEHGESYHVPYIEDGDTYITAVCHSEIQGIVKAYRERSGL